MKPRLTQLVSLLALIALTSGMAGAPLQASIITLTGGDAADASDGIGYAPAAYPVYAYRITGNATVLNNAPGGPDLSAVTYRGITFQPLLMAGGEGAQGSATTKSGPTAAPDGNVKLVDGFAYPTGATDNVGTGGVDTRSSGNDGELFEIAKYQSFATNGNYNDHSGTQTLTLGNLIGGDTYQVDIFVANDHTGVGVYDYTMSGASGPLPTDGVTYTVVAGVHNVYDVREDVVADGSGKITVVVTDSLSDNAPINGFSVEMTPEPASMALLACGSLMLLRRHRA